MQMEEANLMELNGAKAIKHEKVLSANFKKKISGSRAKELLSIYLMVGIPYLLFCIFVIFPLLWILRYAFYDYDGVRATFTGFRNFKVLIQDNVWWKAVVNTLVLSGSGILIGMPISLVFAVILNSKIRGRVFFRAAFYFPCLISTAIVGIVFRIMLAPEDGIINAILMSSGLVNENFYVLKNGFNAMATLAVIGAWQWMGYHMTLILAGLQKIPAELYEAATIDGANEKHKLLYITIPQLGQVLQIIIMLSILGGLKTFDLVNVLTKGHPNHGTETMVTYIFNYFFEQEGYSAQQGYAAAASVVASIIIGAVTLIYIRLSKRLEEN